MKLFKWFSIAGFAVFCLAFEYVLGWLLFFSPGWANGLPSPFSFQAVLAFGMTAYISILLMTAAVGVGAIVGFICALLGVEERRGFQVYGWWLLFAGAAILAASIWIFIHNYNWIYKEFPDGYIITHQAARKELGGI